MEMYLPNKYRVYLGTSLNTGFVTCWNDPEIFLKKYNDFTQYFAIMGTLYSREGVSIILRNLALNPQINKLIVYAGNPLSKTDFGRAGRELLEALWKNGVDESGIVKGNGISIHKEIDTKVIEKIIEHVELIDLSHLKIDDLYLELQKISKEEVRKEYMSSVSFPEPVRNNIASFPSEKVGFSFHGDKIYSVWLSVVESIIRYGDIKKTSGRSDVKELQVVTWTFGEEDLENKFIPDLDNSMLEIIGLKEDSINTYQDIFINPENKKGSGYTYGQRLRDYNGENDQIKNIISLIKEDKYSRRAIASTIIPNIDGTSTNPPCLVFVQVIVDIDSKVNLFATFRSHDIFKAAIPNAFGLLKLQDFITSELGMRKGRITIVSNSAHLYEEDFENAKKLLECQRWGNIKMKFDENCDLDPRGMIKINVIEDNIKAILVDFDGNELIPCDTI